MPDRDVLARAREAGREAEHAAYREDDYTVERGADAASDAAVRVVLEHLRNTADGPADDQDGVPMWVWLSDITARLRELGENGGDRQ